MAGLFGDRQIAIEDVVAQEPELRDQFARYGDTLSPFDLLYTYIKWTGVRVDEGARRAISYLNQDKTSVLLHAKGISFNGHLAQIVEGVPYNPRSVIDYNPFAVALYYQGQRINGIEVNHVQRPTVLGEKYYVRFTSVWNKPVLILDENNGPCAGGCKFCCRADLGVRPSIETGKLLRHIADVRGLSTLASFGEVAIVSGLFLSDAECEQYVDRLIDLLAEMSFHGIVNYIGCQLTDVRTVEHFVAKARSAGMEFQYLYTVEVFRSRRSIMKPIKAKLEFDRMIAYMRELSCVLPPLRLGYNYILGLESLDDFKHGVLALYDTGAVPHVHPFISYATRNFDFDGMPSQGNSAVQFLYPQTGYMEAPAPFILDSRAFLYEIYKDHDFYYLQNNTGLLFFFPGDPQYLHDVKFIKFTRIDAGRIEEYAAWEKQHEGQGSEFTQAKKAYLRDLRAGMTEAVAAFPGS